MTKEEERALKPEVVFVSRELGIPKKWLWYLAENAPEDFIEMADFAEKKEAGLIFITTSFGELIHCMVVYCRLRKLTDDTEWIADAYKTDKREPFPADMFEEFYLEKLAKKEKENDRK